jgi:hypothetical protein
MAQATQAAMALRLAQNVDQGLQRGHVLFLRERANACPSGRVIPAGAQDCRGLIHLLTLLELHEVIIGSQRLRPMLISSQNQAA